MCNYIFGIMLKMYFRGTTRYWKSDKKVLTSHRFRSQWHPHFESNEICLFAFVIKTTTFIAAVPARGLFFDVT